MASLGQDEEARRLYAEWQSLTAHVEIRRVALMEDDIQRAATTGNYCLNGIIICGRTLADSVCATLEDYILLPRALSRKRYAANRCAIGNECSASGWTATRRSGTPSKLVDRPRGCEASADAFDLEIGVVQRRVGEKRAGARAAISSGKSKGTLVRSS